MAKLNSVNSLFFFFNKRCYDILCRTIHLGLAHSGPDHETPLACPSYYDSQTMKLCPQIGVGNPAMVGTPEPGC